MASKKEKRNTMWLEDNYPSGSLSVFLMSEDKRGSGLPDGGDQLVNFPARLMLSWMQAS